MDDSLIPLDIYENIIPFSNWHTLLNLSITNKFLNFLCKGEIRKRWKSSYPLGEKDATIKFFISDLVLDKIYVELPLDNAYMEFMHKKCYLISPKKYFYPFVRDILHDFFVFSFKNKEWSLSHHTIRKASILQNKYIDPHQKCSDINSIYIFKKKDNNYTLIKIL